MATSTETKIIEIKVPIGEGIKQIQLLTAEITKLSAGQAALKKGTDAEKIQYEKNAIAIKEYSRQKQVLQREVQTEIKSVQSAMGAYDKLQLAYTKAQAKAKDLAASNTATGKEIKKAATEANNLNDKLKGIDRTVGQSQRGVGEYERGLAGLSRRFLSFIGVTAIIAGIGSALRNALSVITEFDQQMANVAAITMATKEEMKQLRDIAIQLGGSTKFTASEVAGLEVELGKLGYTTQQIIDATGGVVMAAAATGEGLQKTAEIVGSVTMAFGLSAAESQRVADVMAQSFNATALGLDNFSESIKYVAPIAKQVGVSVEETAALLGVLANSGIKGSMAGTALRRIFSELTKDGGTLQEKLDQLSKSGLNLAGAQDEVGAYAKTALLVLKDQNELIPQLTKEFENSAGAAEIAAAKMLDTIKGQSTILKSTWEGFILSVENGTGRFSTNLKYMLNQTAEFVRGVQRLLMSDADINKMDAQNSAQSRVKDFEKRAQSQKDYTKYLNEEIIAEKGVYQSKLAKSEQLKNENKQTQEWIIATEQHLKSNRDINFERTKNLAAAKIQFENKEKEIEGLNVSVNRSIEYVNVLGNLRRAKSDQNALEIKNQETLDKNNAMNLQTAGMTESEITKNKKAEEDKRLADMRAYLAEQNSIINDQIREYKKKLQPKEATLLEKVTAGAMEVINADMAKNSAIIAADKVTTDAQIANAEKLKQAKIQKAFDTANAGADILEGAFAFTNALAESELALWAKQNKGKANFDEEYAKKKAKLDHQAALRNKVMQVVNALINTAAAVVANLAVPPLAIAAGIAGALQVAAIIATPIPSPESTGGGGSAKTSSLPPDLTSKMASPLTNSVASIQSSGGSNTITSGAANVGNIPMFDYDAMAKANSKIPAPELSIVELRNKEKQVDFIDNISSIKA